LFAGETSPKKGTLSMVIPIADDNTGRRIFPILTCLLIAINAWVFIFFQRLGEDDAFTLRWATVPREIVTGKDLVTAPKTEMHRGEPVTIPGLQPTPISVYLTLLTSMFMHGGLAHILGNMWFLWIFGDNIEDALGHARYVAFYLICGLAASLAHVFATVLISGVDSPAAAVPSLGASGAISGVMGGYLLLHPHRRVTVWVFRFLTVMPAWSVIGMWFLFQLINGLGMLGGRETGGGVAYAAHIGGFLAGVVLIHVFMPRGEPASQPSPPPYRQREVW
jgi:membrane associated rhomboid family serine protease